MNLSVTGVNFGRKLPSNNHKGLKKGMTRVDMGLNDPKKRHIVDERNRKAALYTECKGQGKDYVHEAVLRDTLSQFNGMSLSEILKTYGKY